MWSQVSHIGSFLLIFFHKFEVDYKNMVVKNFQAVVLCAGPGSRLTHLVDGTFKCMLPVLGLPMFWYPLKFLSNNGILNVILVVPERCLEKIKQVLKTNPLNLNITFIALGLDAEDWGTADVLRHIESKITKDFILISGDFISNIDLSPMISMHVAKKATMTCLLAKNVITGPSPGPQVNLEDRDFVAITQCKRILYLNPGDELNGVEDIRLNEELISKFGAALLTTKYNDCHVYIMRKWLLQLINRENSFSSVKADFLPFLIAKQAEDIPADSIIYANTKLNTLDQLINDLNLGGNSNKDVDVKCFAYIAPKINGAFIAHANTMASYFEVNKAMISLKPRRLYREMEESQPEGVYATDCYFMPNCHLLGDPTPRAVQAVVKRSAVGRNCSIGIRAKISNSLVMNNCVINGGAKVSNSILCDNVEIGENAEVNSSIVTSFQKVLPNGKVNQDVINADKAFFK